MRKNDNSGCSLPTVGLVILLLILLMLSGCRSIKYVPVVEHHTETITEHDSIIQHDSIIDIQQTIIREVDSTTMAQYGIELKNMEKAWLIQTDRLQKQVNELLQSKIDSVVIHDSIPTPYPVIQEVSKPLSWWQRTRMTLGEVFMGVLVLGLVLLLIKRMV
jgi:hypothetical protein